MTLTEFLTARIDEDEAAAHEEDADYANTTLLPTYDSEHQARWSTERVLAECEAKRRIVQMWADPTGQWSGPQAEAARAQKDRTLRILALPYADHPDYDEAWRP